MQRQDRLRNLPRETELALVWHEDTATWTIAGNAEEYQLSQQRQEILDVLSGLQDGLTPKEIADLLVKGSGPVRYLLCQMLKDGLVAKTAYGRYIAAVTTSANTPNTPNSANTPNTVLTANRAHPTDDEGDLHPTSEAPDDAAAKGGTRAETAVDLAGSVSSVRTVRGVSAGEQPSLFTGITPSKTGQEIVAASAMPGVTRGTGASVARTSNTRIPLPAQTDYDHDREREREARRLVASGKFRQARAKAEMIRGRKHMLDLLAWIDNAEAGGPSSAAPPNDRRPQPPPGNTVPGTGTT